MNTFTIYEYKEKASGLFGFLKRRQDKAPLGEIVFHNDKVIAAGKVFTLPELKKISIPRFNDYAGRNDEGKHSEGNSNVVVLTFADGTKQTYCFALQRRYELRDTAQVFTAYYKAGKFDFENLVAILGLENYNAIQNFKNTLTIKSY